MPRLVLNEKIKRGQNNKKCWPICLLNVLEKLLVCLILKILESTGSLAKEQYGSQPERSTIHALQKVQEIAKLTTKPMKELTQKNAP